MKRPIFRTRDTVAFLAAVSFLLSLALAPAAFALNPSTPVSSDGAELAAGPLPEGMVAARPFAGTGRITPELLAARAELALSYDEIKALAPATAGVGIESVLGSDTRVRAYTNTYPARATALITFTGGYCTGFFIGTNTVATAGHCVHSGRGGAWRRNVRVYPGYNAGSAPYGSYPSTRLYSVTGWTVRGNESFDYGAVKINSTVGNTVGWYGYLWQTPSLNNTPAIILGYAGDKSPARSAWMSADKVLFTGTEQVFYRNDSFGGQSGSAVWFDQYSGATGSIGPYAYAIHGYGVHGVYPHTLNHGKRITQAAFTNLTNWRNAAP